MKFKVGDRLISDKWNYTLIITEVNFYNYKTLYDDNSVGDFSHSFYEENYRLDEKSMRKYQWQNELNDILNSK